LFEGVNNADVKDVHYCSSTGLLILQTQSDILVYRL
jgi:hypothetical protein